jgi:hypothetical protein
MLRDFNVDCFKGYMNMKLLLTVFEIKGTDKHIKHEKGS